jgi:hypothetical protein
LDWETYDSPFGGWSTDEDGRTHYEPKKKTGKRHRKDCIIHESRYSMDALDLPTFSSSYGLKKIAKANWPTFESTSSWMGAATNTTITYAPISLNNGDTLTTTTTINTGDVQDSIKYYTEELNKILQNMEKAKQQHEVDVAALTETDLNE